MSIARIYRPAKTATQSGRAKIRDWVLEYEPGEKRIDPLMGWTGSGNTLNQIRMKFPSKDAAIAFAEKNGIRFQIHEPRQRQIRPKSYAARFRSPLTG